LVIIIPPIQSSYHNRNRNASVFWKNKKSLKKLDSTIKMTKKWAGGRWQVLFGKFL